MLATNFRSYSCSVLFFLFLINIFLWFMFFYSFHYSFHFISLTLSWRRPFLLGKSMDWFLYGNGLRHERVNYFTNLSGKICVGVSFFQKKSRRLKVSNFIKRKRLRHSCFSLSFVKVFKNNYFVEHPRTVVYALPENFVLSTTEMFFRL